MSDNDAKIKVDGDASAFVRALGAAKAAGRDFFGGLKSGAASAARDVVSSLGSIVEAQGKISFAGQHRGVQEFEAATARLAVGSGRNLETVRTQFESVGKTIGKRPAEVAAWADSVGQLTYNFQGAGEAIEGMAGLAAATGRDVQSYQGLAGTILTVGKAAGSTANAIGVMQAQADALGTKGGVAAFADQIEALTDTISLFSISSERDFAKVTALAGTLGKGLDPRAAGRVQQSVLGTLASDPIGWQRYLGHNIQDDKGHIKDPTKVLEEITAKVKRQYGSQAKRVLQQNFGAEAGAALFNADFGEAAKLSGLAASTKPAAAQKALNATDAGGRAVAAATLDASSRNLMGSSTLLGRAADSLQRFAASNPITSTIVTTALSTGAGKAFEGLGKFLGGLKGGGGGGAADAAGKLATAGKAGGFLGKAVPIVGALAAGVGVGAEIGGYLDEKYGDKFDEVTGIDGKKQLAGMDAETARLKKIRDQKRAERAFVAARAGKVGEDGTPMLLARPGEAAAGPLAGGVDTKAISDAVREGFKDAKIVNSTGGPVEVATQGASSSAAGNQG